MAKQQKHAALRFAAIGSVIILAAIIIWATVKPKPIEVPRSRHRNHNNHSHSELLTETSNEAKETDDKLADTAMTSLDDIVKQARTWLPAYKSWWGKMAPDFTLTDINGKQHKLSDYRGKNVLIIFWATWCIPCLMEIPHLIELRNDIGEDKLAMLAISEEGLGLVKSFAADYKINYTVLVNTGRIPKPYRLVTAIPTSFFIDPEGKIKLATAGLVSLAEIKAILRAK